VEAVVPRPAGHALDCLPKSLRSGRTVPVWRLPLLLPLLNRSGHRKGVSPLTIARPPYPASHPFVWFPLAGQRHAIDRRDRNVSVGVLMRCLCGVTHPRRGESKMEWLWPTCEGCWDEACRIVGVRGRE
jgi:hypothetical protein